MKVGDRVQVHAPGSVYDGCWGTVVPQAALHRTAQWPYAVVLHEHPGVRGFTAEELTGPSESLTVEQWREAFRRLAIIEDWRQLHRPSAAGADGTEWCSETEKFDPEALARKLLDDAAVQAWWDDGCFGLGDWLLDAIFGRWT